MPKAYDFGAHERRLYEWWESQRFFTPEAQAELGQSMAGAPPFVISMPPPNVTGALHMGHAVTAAIEDLMIRFHRLRGRPTLWVPGSDHAGIATQNVVERALAAEGTTRQELGREAFVQRVWAWKEEYGGRISEQHRRLGVSCDWNRERFTLDEGLSRAVAEAFVRLYQRGLIYRGLYLVNWCPRCQSVISDIEVEHNEVAGRMYTFRYPLAGGGFLPVATTRPETILGDTAVAVHPDDERHAEHVGRTALVPMLDRPIPVLADEYVDREFGTGALKVTPGHDPNDYEIGKRHGLAEVNILNEDGTLNENAGPYAGLDRFAARAALWSDMREAGLVIDEVPHHHSVGHCQRCHTMVEPLLSTQWFVKMKPLAEPAIEAVQEGRVRILPRRFESEYFHWLHNIRDWVISRQLWWGHRIPVWYGPDGKPIAARSEAEARALAHERFGDEVALTQDEDVLDTWFSSSLWPFSSLGWPDETEDLALYYPTDVLETGYDILFFWVARMIFMAIAMTGEVPFRHVYLHGLLRDAEGRKISKSLGTAIDPLELIDRYGCDALRFALVTGSTPGQDMKLADERLEDGRNFANKLWNVGRLIVGNLPEGFEPLAIDEVEQAWEKLELVDQWILSRQSRVIADVTRLIEAFQFGEAGRTLYEFMWSELADWHVEAAKTRLYGDDEAAREMACQVLYAVLERSLTLLHPFMPYVTEAIWGHLPPRPDAPPGLVVSRWPQPRRVDEDAIASFGLLRSLIRGVRNARAEYNVEPGMPIPAVINAGARSELFRAQVPLLAFLARLDPEKLEIGRDLPRPAAAHATVIVGAGVAAWLPLESVIDLERERARIGREAEAARAEVRRLQAVLANDQFVRKAPEDVVQRERDRLANAEARLAVLEDRLASLTG